MHKFILMFAILATISMSSLAKAQPPGGQRGEGGQRGGAQRGEGGQRGGGQRGGGAQRGGGQRGQRPASPMMTALDTNKDGQLSSEEIAGAAMALKTLDKNKDGVLDATELTPERGGQAGGGNSNGMVDRVMERDADKDGKVSKEEAGDRMGRIFDRMDEDGDGFVTRPEVEKMSQQFQGGGGRAGGGGGRAGGGGGGRNQPETKKERPAFDE